MKIYLPLLYIYTLLFIGCGKPQKGYVIEGILPSPVYDGEWIYLVPMENPMGRVDSVKIANASFSFSGKGEEMRVLRLRYALRPYIQELLVITEPGTIYVKAESIGSVKGTPQNNALQEWKEMREKGMLVYCSIHEKLQNAIGDDSLRMVSVLDSLFVKEQNFNYLFLQKQKSNTLGKFMRKMLRASLSNEQQHKLDEN